MQGVSLAGSDVCQEARARYQEVFIPKLSCKCKEHMPIVLRVWSADCPGSSQLQSHQGLLTFVSFPRPKAIVPAIYPLKYGPPGQQASVLSLGPLFSVLWLQNTKFLIVCQLLSSMPSGQRRQISAEGREVSVSVPPPPHLHPSLLLSLPLPDCFLIPSTRLHQALSGLSLWTLINAWDSVLDPTLGTPRPEGMGRDSH